MSKSTNTRRTRKAAGSAAAADSSTEATASSAGTSASDAASDGASRLAGLAEGLTPVELLFVQRALSSERVRGLLEAAVPDGTEAAVDVSLRVQGALKVGHASTRAPTSRALSRATLALLVRRLGLQRDAALALLSEVLIAAHTLDENAEKVLLEEHPEVESAFAYVHRFLETLPRIPTKGRVSVVSPWMTRLP